MGKSEGEGRRAGRRTSLLLFIVGGRGVVVVSLLLIVFLEVFLLSRMSERLAPSLATRTLSLFSLLGKEE